MKIKRPLCTAAFIWAAVLWLLGRTGLDFFSFASPDPPIKIEKEKVVATGTVYQKDVYDSITNLYLRNSNLIIQEKKYPIENIKVTLENQKLTDSVFQGDLTAVYGSLEQIPRASNPGQFDERSYYYPRKVKWYLEGMEFQVLRKKENQVLYIQSQIRERMKEGIQKAFGEEKGGIIQAMVLGEKGELGQENKLLFQIMGTSHVLAISGMHLSVLGWGFYKLLVKMRLSVKAAGILAAAAMGFYGELTGSGAAAVRAVIMFAVSIGALLLKRTYDFLSALSLSAILLLAESPLYLYDSSFLLSFGAVLGLAAVHPVLFPPGKKKYKTNLWGKVKKELDAGIFSSISVWSILLPISMYFFYELSVWGFLVNLLILPTVGVLLISGLAGGILGLLPGLLLARAGALPGILILEFYIHIGKSVQKLPVFLWITGKPDIWQCLFYYGILAGILLIKKKGKRIFAGKLAAMTAALCLLFLRFPEGRLKVTFLDVGQGDCACIQQGKDVCYIIDGGSSTISRAGQAPVKKVSAGRQKTPRKNVNFFKTSCFSVARAFFLWYTTIYDIGKWAASARRRKTSDGRKRIMANHVVISICGEEYTFVAEEASSYMQRVGSYVNDKMAEVLDSSKVGRTDAAVLTAVNIADELFKAQAEADQLRAQIKGYLDEAGRAQSEVSDLKREVFRLQQKLDAQSRNRG